MAVTLLDTTVAVAVVVVPYARLGAPTVTVGVEV